MPRSALKSDEVALSTHCRLPPRRAKCQQCNGLQSFSAPTMKASALQTTVRAKLYKRTSFAVCTNLILSEWASV
jgi:hypothetical protein